MAWLDFLPRAAASYRRWLPTGPARQDHLQRALQYWYRKTPP
jgi:hypothetical protein